MSVLTFNNVCDTEVCQGISGVCAAEWAKPISSPPLGLGNAQMQLIIFVYAHLVPMH